MATASSNYTASGTQFSIPASTDEQTDITLFLIRALQALEDHTHASTRGAAVARVAATSAITMTAADGTSGVIVTASTGTNPANMRFTNTAGNAYVGLDSSTGSWFGGNAGYTLGVYAPASTPIELTPGATPANRVTIATTGATTFRGSVTISSGFNVEVGGGAARSVTSPTNAINIYNGTAPSGTLTNGVTLYSAAGELRVMDAAGNSTLLSPHDDDGAWVFDSIDTTSGRRLRIDVERLLRFLNAHHGLDFVHEEAG